MPITYNRDARSNTTNNCHDESRHTIRKSVDDLHGDCSGRRSILYRALSSIRLVPVEAGHEINIGGEIQKNNCLWKSFAASFLNGQSIISDPTFYYSAPLEGDTGVRHLEVVALHDTDDLKVGQLALKVKRDAKKAIEARPTKLTPAKERVKREIRDGEQSPSDLLLYLICSTNSKYEKLCIVIFDFLSGNVEILRGNKYDGCGDEYRRKHTLTVRIIDEHYQPLFPFYGDGAVRPNLDEIKNALNIEGIRALQKLLL